MNRDLKKSADTIRLLAADMIQKANSGHPGLPMGMADTATILWTKFLRHHPEHSHWVGRDRFILSPGHGSTLLYSLLHLSGYDLSLEDLKDFRQWGSKTPGHPEYGHTHGVEVTTGPLGQGFANGVGMAIAAKKLEADAAQYTNTPKMPGQRIWAIVSDGDMMEGITHEAASFAGHLKLDNMIYIYDKNNISIEGNTDIAFTESVEDRFKAYGWHTLNMDAHNHEEIEQTLTEAMTLENAPVLIIATSHIGFGSPNKQDSAGVHGAPLGADELALTKKNFGFNEMDSFVVPEDVYGVFAERKTELDKIYKDWCEQLEFLRRSDKKAAALWDETMTSPDNAGLWQKLQSAVSGSSMASRKASGNMLQIIAENIPGFIGGSADLAPSNNTHLKNYSDINTADFSGRNFHYGIREHAMGAITNGIALFGKHIPFDATFLVFADYMRPSLRLASMMNLNTIHVFTHDSIFVGEDGPTHQPVEHTASLRLIPGLNVLRPADEIETAAAWYTAVTTKNQSFCMILSRQNIPPVKREKPFSIEDFQKGGYIIYGNNNPNPECVVMTSGSELPVLMDAIDKLSNKEKIRIISVPSLELLKKSGTEYLDSLIPESVKNTISFEVGSAGNYYEFAKGNYTHIGLDHFGASAPAGVLQKKFGLDADSVAEKIQEIIK